MFSSSSLSSFFFLTYRFSFYTSFPIVFFFPLLSFIPCFFPISLYCLHLSSYLFHPSFPLFTPPIIMYYLFHYSFHLSYTLSSFLPFSFTSIYFFPLFPSLHLPSQAEYHTQRNQHTHEGKKWTCNECETWIFN